MRSRAIMEMRVRITVITRYVSLHRLARREHSHNPLLSHPACHKSEQRRAKSYLGAWGGNIFSECRFLYLLAPPISNSNPLKWTACSAFRSLPCNGQLAPKTTDRTETSLRVRGGRGAWERGNLSWKSGVSRDIENGTH